MNVNLKKQFVAYYNLLTISGIIDLSLSCENNHDFIIVGQTDNSLWLLLSIVFEQLVFNSLYRIKGVLRTYYAI